MKIPKDMDFSSIDRNPPQIVKGFDPKELQGTWYKVSWYFAPPWHFFVLLFSMKEGSLLVRAAESGLVLYFSRSI